MFERIRTIIATKFQLSAERIQHGTSLTDHLGLDSLDLVELSLIIQKDVGIEISDDELGQVRTVGAVAELVESRATSVG